MISKFRDPWNKYKIVIYVKPLQSLALDFPVAKNRAIRNFLITKFSNGDHAAFVEQNGKNWIPGWMWCTS